MTRQAVSPVFAGREHELNALLDALGQVRAGTPRVVLAGGEAGVGKTRLIGEFAQRAREAGARVLVGGCLELSSAGLPYAPFTAALRELVSDGDPAEVAALVPPEAAGDLARLLPELGAPAPDADPDLAHMRLFEQVLALLERLAAGRPAVLVVEDAHWADHSTRDLLTFLTRNLRRASVLLVVTYRADDLHRRHPLRPLLAELSRLPIVTRLDLPRLSREEVATQLGGILGRPADPALVELVHSRSEGIPLFVEAVLGTDGTAAGDLPESLRDLLMASVQRLPDGTQRALLVATVAGDRVGHALLAETTGLDDDALSETVRPAVAANVLIPDERGYAFRHALIREAVRGDLLPGERTALHRRYAEALTRSPELSESARPNAELAAHWAAAHDNERALAAAWDAAAEAAAALSYGERFQMLELVLELWERVPDAAARIGADHTAVLELAAECAHTCGESDRGLRLITAALSALDPAAEPERTALAYLERARLRATSGTPGGTDDLLAAERIAREPGPVRASVLAILGGELLETGENEQGRAMIEEAVALARTLGDASAESDALTTSGLAAALAGDLPAAHVALEGSRSTAERGGSARRLVRAFVNLSAAQILQARHGEAVETAREGVALARRLGHARPGGVYIALNQIEAEFRLGRWDDMIATYEQTMTLNPSPPQRGSLLAYRAEVALARGERQVAAGLVAAARKLAARLSRFGAAEHAQLLIRWRGAEDDPSGALDETEAALARFGPTANPWYLWPLLVAGMRACGLADRPPSRERAGQVRGALVEIARELPAHGPYFAARRAEVDAEAAPDDREAWEAAVAGWEATGEPYPLAGALVRAAEGVAAAGDRDGAAARLARAAELARELRALPMAEEIDRLARRVGVANGDPARAADDRLGLTPRELEVLRLLAGGMSNRELAGELFISVKTVSVHVSNILGKLGVSSRGEAAATAHRLRLFG
ncbi:helix-turn-helix transcriptional regulator [Spongiactinospora sp. TRM90649]|uniref:helix-turn-helix transcriptional regulator n=1 Tax=Spongiactinospora sp. TRM90649 TaxID=3031114 RepID=UPI0023F6B810|nr:helix-turn-helix transcriptional regulator [Spongiactinospora sp. TRM90649]MDF5752468.1 AAA family ATPase [Spongiactinospora sp. TRM90649]